MFDRVRHWGILFLLRSLGVSSSCRDICIYRFVLETILTRTLYLPIFDCLPRLPLAVQHSAHPQRRRLSQST
jgi:hypothetical protein